MWQRVPQTKRIVSQWHNLCVMGMFWACHVWWLCICWAAEYSGPFPCIESKTVVSVKTNHLLDIEQWETFESSIQISWLSVRMNDFYSMILQVLKLFMCVLAQLPQTTLHHLNLVCTRFLYSVRQDAIEKNLTCFIEDIKTNESFLHNLSTCLSHFHWPSIVTPSWSSW